MSKETNKYNMAGSTFLPNNSGSVQFGDITHKDTNNTNYNNSTVNHYYYDAEYNPDQDQMSLSSQRNEGSTDEIPGNDDIDDTIQEQEEKHNLIDDEKDKVAKGSSSMDITSSQSKSINQYTNELSDIDNNNSLDDNDNDDVYDDNNNGTETLMGDNTDVVFIPNLQNINTQNKNSDSMTNDNEQASAVVDNMEIMEVMEDVDKTDDNMLGGNDKETMMGLASNESMSFNFDQNNKYDDKDKDKNKDKDEENNTDTNDQK